MKDTELYMRLRGIGVDDANARKLTHHIRDSLHPVSAVAASRILQAAGNPGVNGLAGNTGSAVKYGATGAKVGSAFGPIGTAVGAVVGIVAGLLIKTGQKPQRMAAAQAALQQLRQIAPDFAGRLISDKDFEQLFFALFLASGWHNFEGSKLIDHPTSLHNLSAAYQKTVLDIVNAAARTPVGGVASVPMLSAQGSSSRPIGTFQFVNPGLDVGAGQFMQTVLLPMIAARNQPYGAGRIAELQSNADAQHVLALLFDKDSSIVSPDTVSSTVANSTVARIPVGMIRAGTMLAQPYLQGTQSRILQYSGTPFFQDTQANMPALSTRFIQAPVGPMQNANGVQLQTTNDVYPINAVLSPQQAATAGVMQDQLAQGGYNFNSQPAQQVLADVAAQGVDNTGRVPKPASSVPGWLPAAGVAVGIALLDRMKK